MTKSDQIEFELFKRKGLGDYISAGKRIKEAQELAASGRTGKTFAQMLAELPFSRRQAFYLMSVYEHRAELKAAGIISYSAALRFIKSLRRERRSINE